MRIKPLLPLCCLVALITVAPRGTYATDSNAEQSQQGFLATWKLLTADQKRDFISGYLYGWKDAGRVTGIAIDFIRDNPKKAVESLESIRGLYDFSGLDLETLVREINHFYSGSDNKNATLASAVTAARSKLR